MKKYRVAFRTPRAAGILTKQIHGILKSAMEAGHFRIAVIVYGKEYDDGYKAGHTAGYKSRDRIIIDEAGLL